MTPAIAKGTFATRELAFVAAATRWPRSPADTARTAAIATTVSDWPLVLRLTETHRVVGLVADAVGMLPGDALPPPDRAALLAEARAQAVDDLRYAHETVRLVHAFEAAEIAVVVLKGAAVAREVFGRFGLRSSIDIDLLVAPADVAEAARILGRMGLARTEPAADASHADLRDRLARHKDFVFWNDRNGHTVELHWRLFQNPMILPAITPMLGRPMELLSGENVPVLPLRTTALYLCVHGGEHGWARLKWLADIGALLRAGAVDADMLYADACTHKVRRMVGPGLVLAHRIYDTALPTALVRHLRHDWRMRRLVDVAWTCLVGEEDGRELEERAFATTRKNLSHYLVSAHPRHLWREFWFDVHDAPLEADGCNRLTRLARRAWGLVRGNVGTTAVKSPEASATITSTTGAGQ